MKKDLTASGNILPTPVKAGFPNPAADAAAVALDLNELIVRHPVSTFYMQVEGDALQAAGIKNGDIAVVDKSLQPKQGDLVVCVVEGEFGLRYFKREGDKAWLVAGETPIALHTNDIDASIWGVVTFVIHRFHQ